MKESPGWTRNNAPVLPKLLDAAKAPVTWKMCFLYAVVFGGFVSFATYLPTYLRDVYSFDPSGAGARTAGFALAAVLARPVGGVLADRVGPKPVVVLSLAGVAVLGLGGEPAARRRCPRRPDVRGHGGRAGAGHRRRVRLGGGAARRRAGGQHHRSGQCGRRPGRLLPAAGHGRHVRSPRPAATPSGSCCLAATALVAFAYTTSFMRGRRSGGDRRGQRRAGDLAVPWEAQSRPGRPWGRNNASFGTVLPPETVASRVGPGPSVTSKCVCGARP